jgi:dienelactone hydrolase
VGLLLVGLLASSGPAADSIERSPELPETTPWNLAALSRPPAFEWIDEKGPVLSLAYAGETYRGRPTRVFAYYATPGTLNGDRSRDRALPAVVLVHGGGGTAFREWAELWARRGYAAIAMDLAGHRPIEGKNAHQRENRTRLDDGGPDQSDTAKFETIEQGVTEHWPYHAVANVIRAHSLLRSFREIDPQRTAVTGISWGGYLTCIVASLDNRFRAAVPVYGCGFLHENSAWKEARFEKMPAEQRERWVGLYDPSQYLPSCRVPILFVNGTNDFAYPLDSYMRSFSLVESPKNIRITVDMPHGHPPGWAPAEIGAFVDQHLRGGRPLPRLGTPAVQNGRCSAGSESVTRIVQASLHYASGSGPINTREWTTVPAVIEDAGIAAALPEDAAVWFLTATDERDLTVSSEVVFASAR